MVQERPREVPQQPRPEENDPPRSGRDPREPTSTAPASVEESVYDEAEHAGASGPDEADPPRAAGKSDAAEDPDVGSVADLDPDEAADILETREEARRVKDGREEDRRDEDLISLDGTD
ncbi:hypothetical protein J4H92_14285 [Leucobacter weissii]|uniref:Uncharacterized protein n=1 Tax=Leucobacter weissii TaxID=1983706 RepID=A0A939MUC3_9MICO|nr:hypothetical protein [Leucobacter weissii]MBO1903109.1 hypothetical protein [Leucobacter weissii]